MDIFETSIAPHSADMAKMIPAEHACWNARDAEDWLYCLEDESIRAAAEIYIGYGLYLTHVAAIVMRSPHGEGVACLNFLEFVERLRVSIAAKLGDGNRQ